MFGGIVSDLRNVAVRLVLLFAVSVVPGFSHAQDSLRTRLDSARNRLWVLGLDDVRVYDAATKQLLQRIVLPGWAVVRYACPPDLALDSSGSAIVASNVQSRLWRIDADQFSVQAHAITLLERERWDTGFGALAIDAGGNLYALAASTGSLWHIDIGKASARLIGLDSPLLNVCGLERPLESGPAEKKGAAVIFCMNRDATRRLALSPNLARGRVVNAPCNFNREGAHDRVNR
jgi:DNA-binding beta-propeller fold protein YncE